MLSLRSRTRRFACEPPWSTFSMKPKLEARRDAHNLRSTLKSSFALASCLIAFGTPNVAGQNSSDVKQVLDRLDRSEAENRRLADEVRMLREELRRRTGGPEEP